MRGAGDADRVKVIKLKVRTLGLGQVAVGSGVCLEELSQKPIYELQVSGDRRWFTGGVVGHTQVKVTQDRQVFLKLAS